MKYQLLMYMDPTVWAALSDDQHNAVFAGHEAFAAKLAGSGELLSTQAVTDPGDSLTVRVRDGATSTTPGLLHDTSAFLCGHYVVDCASRDRAVELAALIPDAAYTAVEVRRVIHEADFGS
jgi:hypothetical protein